MDKKILIDFVNEIAEKTKIANILVEKPHHYWLWCKDFQKLSTLTNKSLQHRENVECFLELKMIIENWMGHRPGWGLLITSNYRCGEVFLDYIERIKAETDGEKEEDVLKNCSLFFGYTFWKATILAVNRERKLWERDHANRHA